MPRKSTKNNTETTMSAIDEAINTPVNFQFCELAEALGIGDAELRERLEDKTGSSEVHQMDTIPCEWEPAIEAIARDIEAEKSVRRLGESAVEELPEAQQEKAPEPPILEDEPKQEKKKRQRRQSTALTKKKSEALRTSDEKAQQLAGSEIQIKQALHVKKGVKSGAQLATLELAAEDATYRQIKGEALVRKVAQLSSELASEADFDPTEALKEFGIGSNSEILKSLREQIEPTLGKLQTATGEIVANAWVNGIDLETEFGVLENLLNSNGSTSDY
jgi:hypothetical protein